MKRYARSLAHAKTEGVSDKVFHLFYFSLLKAKYNLRIYLDSTIRNPGTN